MRKKKTMLSARTKEFIIKRYLNGERSWCRKGIRYYIRKKYETFSNLVWNGWKYLTRPFEVIVSDMTAF